MVVWTDRVGYNRIAGVLYTLLEHNNVSIFNNGEELMSMQFAVLFLNLMINGDYILPNLSPLELEFQV